jgi:hypothetical protein
MRRTGECRCDVRAGRRVFSFHPPSPKNRKGNRLCPEVGARSEVAAPVRRQDAGATGQEARLRGARGGRPPAGACGAPRCRPRPPARGGLFRAARSFGRRRSVRGAGRLFAPRPTLRRSGGWRSDSDRVGFTHGPWLVAPARRRPLPSEAAGGGGAAKRGGGATDAEANGRRRGPGRTPRDREP